MAIGIVYLDVDDEITSAAARIRNSAETKVALVVPYGSRIATSRMNFRLLSREALVSNRRLSIVAADPGTRALAASAGLPVFASVAEYESAAAALTVSEADAPPDESAEAEAPPTRRRRSKKAAADAAAAAAAATAAAEALTAEAVATEAAATLRAAARPEAAPDETQVVTLPEPPARDPGPAGRLTPTAVVGAPADPADVGDLPGSHVRMPQPAARRSISVGSPLVIGGAVALLALLLLGFAAFLFLPAATITLTPRQEPIGPIALEIQADPTATAPDPARNIVPAITVDVPVEVSQTFTTVGRRITETKAKGTVTFSNYDPTSANTIPAGSIVSTEGGIKFRTLAIVRLPAARFVIPEVVPSQRDVAVEAAAAGTSGNVPANTIRAVPAGENPTFTRVNNAQPTSGGEHNESPQVSQKDIDAAFATLRKEIQDKFAAAVASGAGAPPNATVFPETASLGDTTPTVDPATLVNQQVDTFDLGLTADASVIAVDSSPISQIAQARLLSNVGADHRLVDGSIRIVPGDPTVTNGVVTFPVTASAARVKILDDAALHGLIRGRPVEEARSLLSPYGEVSITTWPSWVTTIPGFDARVSLAIVGQAGGTPGPSAGSTSPSASPAASASASRPASASPPASSSSTDGSPASASP